MTYHKKIIQICLLLLPFLMLGQHQIWYKTQKQITELIQGDWVVISKTFEGKETIKEIKRDYGFSAYKKNDSLKVDEFHYINNKKESGQPDINATVEKSGSKYFFGRDYLYKIYHQEIKFIDTTKLILEEGPNISTFKRIKS